MRTTAPARSRRAVLRTLVALALLPAALVACGGGDGPTGPGGGPTGTYALRTVNGANLPAVVFENGADRAEMTAGSVTLNGNATYTSSFTIRTVLGGTTSSETVTGSGRYTVSGTTLSLTHDDGGDTETATISGNTITARTTTDDVTFTAVFEK